MLELNHQVYIFFSHQREEPETPPTPNQNMADPALQHYCIVCPQINIQFKNRCAFTNIYLAATLSGLPSNLDYES